MEDEEKNEGYFVDIPNSSDPESYWINIKSFPTKEEAITYVKNTFGGDDEGRIKLITKI